MYMTYLYNNFSVIETFATKKCSVFNELAIASICAYFRRYTFLEVSVVELSRVIRRGDTVRSMRRKYTKLMFYRGLTVLCVKLQLIVGLFLFKLTKQNLNIFACLGWMWSSSSSYM